MHILWLGPFYSDLAVRGKKAPNLAAERWSFGLLKALARNGIDISVLSHCPEQVWPLGNLWQNADRKWFRNEYPCVGVPYLNLPIVRDEWLTAQYRARFKECIGREKIDAVVCYNSLYPWHVAAMKEARRLQVPTFPIILDSVDPRADQWRRLLYETRYANGVVFLSDWAVRNFPQKKPVLHLDGGSDAWHGKTGAESDSCRKKKNVVYTGALDYWRGLNFMTRVVRLCNRTDVRFIFCGKCNRTVLQKHFDDVRVDVQGYVSEAKLSEIMLSADVFLNVREPTANDNIINFPSKVPQYLSYGKPVISTWIDSLSPEYRDILCVAEKNTPEDFTQVLNSVLDWSPEEYMQCFDKTRRWFLEKKTWDIQAKRLLRWMSDNISEQR